MTRKIIHTDNAPKAIGTYSQAVKAGNTIYLSGQIGLDPASMQMVEGIEAQIHQVLRNLKAVSEAAGGSLDDIVKLNIYLTDLAHFAKTLALIRSSSDIVIQGSTGGGGDPTLEERWR